MTLIEPQRRLVVLGASNVVRGLRSLVAAAREAWGEPLDLLAAIGHGRSYGVTTRVLGRSLPGILPCGLWDARSQRPALPTAALLTDVGNDLVFGTSPAIVARWVEECVARLRPCCDRVVLTELPLESLRTLTPWRFRLMRSVLFPRSRLELPDAIAASEELNDRVREIAARYELTTVRPRGAWYGFDPIHIRRREEPAAWRALLAPFSPRETSIVRGSWGEWLHLRTRRPLQRWMFGFEQRRAQPCATLRDGTRVSFY